MPVGGKDISAEKMWSCLKGIQDTMTANAVNTVLAFMYYICKEEMKVIIDKRWSSYNVVIAEERTEANATSMFDVTESTTMTIDTLTAGATGVDKIAVMFFLCGLNRVYGATNAVYKTKMNQKFFKESKNQGLETNSMYTNVAFSKLINHVSYRKMLAGIDMYLCTTICRVLKLEVGDDLYEIQSDGDCSSFGQASW